MDASTTTAQQYISLSQATRYFIVDGRKPSPSSVWRWSARGLDIAGQRVKLRVYRVAGRLATTERDIEQFREACTNAHMAGIEPDDDGDGLDLSELETVLTTDQI